MHWEFLFMILFYLYCSYPVFRNFAENGVCLTAIYGRRREHLLEENKLRKRIDENF